MFRFFTCISLFFISTVFGLPEKTTPVVVGIAKNCELRISNAFNFIKKIKAEFPESKVFIYENDSIDTTPQLLNKISKKTPGMKFLSEQSLPEGFKEFYNLNRQPTRFDHIARARNVYMRELTLPDYDHCTHVIVMDMDLLSYPTLSSIKLCFERDDWDCVSSNGRHAISGIYYDTFAFRDNTISLGPEICGINWWKQNPAIQKVVQGPANTWKEVFSAFGGLAIYKKSSIKDVYYSGFITSEMLEEAEELVRVDENTQNLLKKTTGYTSITLRTPLFAFEEYSVPGSCCEHVILHHQMRQKGFSRIFLNRNMLTSWIH